MKRTSFVLSLILAASVFAQTDAIHRDDFQSYKTPSNPPGWVDTSVGNPKPQASGLYKAWNDPLQGNHGPNVVYGTKQSSGKPEGNNPRIGTFSTLTTKRFDAKGRFEYQGRLIRTNADSRVGLTFLSSYPETDNYYLIGLWSQPGTTKLTMQLFRVGAGALQGTIDSNVVIDPNKWYRFNIQVEDVDNATKIRARFWPDGTAEPSTFAIDAIDAAASRLTSGRIGMWAAVKGDAYIDDIVAKSPVDHAAPLITFADADTQRVLDPSLLALFKTPARIEIRIDDLSTVTSSVKLDGAAYTSGTPIVVDGLHEITVTAVDAPGNTATASLDLLVDQVPPVVALTIDGNAFAAGAIFDHDVTVSVAVQDVSTVTPAATLNGATVALPQPIAEERVHAISVTATDQVGWQSTSASTFVVDKSAPTLRILANAIDLGGGESFQDDVTLTWSATDLTLDRIEATLNGAPITSGTVVSAERIHDLIVVAHDKAGHATTETRRFVLDKTAPEVRVLVNGETLSGGVAVNAPVVFTVEASDTTQTTTVATIDGQSYTPGTTYGVEGVHTITVVVTDASGLATTVGPTTFTIDLTPPSIVLSEAGEPFRDGLEFNRDVNVVVTASDNLDPNPTRELVLNGLSYPLATPITEERADHSITAKATDAAGNTTSVGPFRFVLDKTRPVVTLTDEESGRPFAADDLFGRPVRVKVTVADMTATTIAATLNGASFDPNTTITADGTYTVSVVATDEVGWASDPVTATFTIDQTPPQLTFTSHQEGAVVGTPSIVVSGGSDDAVVVLIDNAPITLDFAAKTFVSDSIALEEGPNTIVVTGIDKAGNPGSATLHLELDTRAPELAIAAPAADACIAANEIVVRGSARDAVSVRVRANDGAFVDATINGSEWTATVPLPVAGKVVLFVEAIDRVAHASSAAVPITVDRTKPVIVVTEGGAPFTGTLFNRILAPLVHISDADIHATLTVTLDGNPFASGAVLRDDATHVLRATATDCAGNTSAFEHTFTIDRTPPRIESFSPANGSTVGSTPSLSGTLSEPATLIDEASGTGANVDGVNFSFPSTWSEGINERIFVATDLAGNASRTPYSVRVKTEKPIVEIVENGEPIAANSLFNRIVKPVIRVSDPSAAITATLNGAAFTSGTNVTADAAYTLIATATDSVGHASDPVTATFTIDRTAPHVDITSPSEGASVTTTNVEVRGTVDADAASVTINGVAATISGSTFVANIVLEQGSTLITATARDRAGNNGFDRVEVTRAGGPLAIILTSPPDQMLTNRPTTVVAGQVLTQPPSGTVVVNGVAIPVSAGGAFRKIDFPLVEGANTITASVTSAGGQSNSVTVNVNADFTQPTLRVTANALELADGARFATSPQIGVDASDDVPQGLVTELTIDGARISGAIPTLADGGHALTAIARDAAGNETRIDRTFFVGSSVAATGCGLSNIDPVDGAAVFVEQLRITGRSGGAASVLIDGNAAQVADGSFCGEVTLEPGRNEIVIRCADASGNPTSDEPVTLIVYRDVEPTIAITSPTNGSTATSATVTVTGTVGAGVVSGDVNGLAFEVPRDGAASHTFTVPNVTLTSGLNTIVARAKTGASRTAIATARVTLLNAAPQVFITSPIEATETGAPSLDVSGGYVNVDPSTITVNGTAATTVATSSTSGTFRATVSLASGLASTITARGRNAAGVEDIDTIHVQHVVGAPSISIASPADNAYLSSTATEVAVAGTFDAAQGSQVVVNGVVATLNAGAFSANVPISSAGATPIVARVSTPNGENAMDAIRVIRMTAPLALRDSFPAANATGVDRGVAIIVLFNNPLDATTVDGALRVTDSAGATIAGQVFIDRDAVTFAPNDALQANERYTIALATSLKDASGIALASAHAQSFTTSATAPAAPPIVDDIETSGCFTSITLTGRASVPGARVRLDADGVTLTTVASDTGAFKFTFSFSGQAGFHIARVRQAGADGSLSAERALCFRVNCEVPRVIGATLDRTAKKLVIDFSRAMDPSTLILGNTIVLDPTINGSATFANQSATIAFNEDVPPVKVALTVKKEVKDVDGASMAADYSQEFHIDTGSPERGKGYVTGAVYDATTGRPLAGANIDIAGVVTPTDDRGRYSRALDEGAYTIAASADGHTPVWRQVVVPAGAGVVPIDIRLTRRGDAGGETTVTKKVELTLDSASLPPGATTQLTAIGAQALAGLLPLGWSPLASAEIVGPASLPGARLTFVTGDAPRTLTLVQYDATRDEWRIVVAAAVVAGGRVTLDVDEPGHYALVFPDDAAHLAHPPAPQTGAALQGIVNPCIAEPAQCALTSRSFTLEPRAILPNGRAVATLVTEGATQIYPSGTAVQAYIDEQLNLADGRVLVDPPFATDLLLYRTFAGDSAVADFHLAPTPQAATVTLRDGVEHIRFVEYPGRIDRGTLLGNEGGRVPSDGGITIDVPSGATPEPLHASASSIPASEFPAIAGFRVAGGFTLSLTRVSTIPPADGVVDNTPSLVIPARATFVVPDSALVTQQVIVAEVIPQTPYGALYRLVAIAERVDDVAGGKLFATANIDSTQLPIDGVVRDGRYVVLVAESPIAYAFGLVRAGPAGSAIGDARVTANGLGVASLTPRSGLFVVPVLAQPAAPFSLVARTLATGDGAAATAASAPHAGAFVDFGTLSLVAQPPALRSVTPDGGEIAVTAAFVVRAEFDTAIDPASVANGVVVTNLTTSTPLAGTVVAAGNNVTFNAGEPLRAASLYAITINASIRGMNGAPFGQTVVKNFRTLSRPSDTTVRPELIRITMPDANGKSEIRGAATSLPAGSQAVAVRRGADFVVRYQATVATDGSFSFELGHQHANDAIALDDLIDLQVIDAVSRGVIAVVPLTPFASSDLRSFIAPAGRDTTFLSADNIRVRVPAGAFDVPTRITVNLATKTAFADVPNFDQQLKFGAAVELTFDGIAKKRLDVDLPVPSGVATDGHEWLVGQLGNSIRGPRVMIVDLAYANSGRFFSGIAPAGGSGARYLAPNEVMTGPELRDNLNGINRSGIFATVFFETVAGPVGFAALQGIQAGYDLFWDTLDAVYAAHWYLAEGRGKAVIPIVFGRQFQLVGVDASTGIEAFTKVYDPIPEADPGTIPTLAAPVTDKVGPYPILGSPFRIELLDLHVEDVDILAIRDFRVRLSSSGFITAITTLDEDVEVAMLNVTKGTIDPSRGGGLTVAGALGDRIVLMVGERNVDPYTSFSIVFSEKIAAPADEEALTAHLREMFKITLDGQPIEGQLRIRLDSQRRVTFETPASLKRGARYRLEISKDLADESGLKIGQTRDDDGVASPELADSMYLEFEVREPGGKVGSFDLASGVVRDQALNGNVLLVSALDGGIVAYDVSNPAGLTASTTPIGHHPGGLTEYWALASDHHGRIYSTGMTSLMGLVRSFRLEDFTKGDMNVGYLSAAQVSFVPGAAASMNIASRVIASDRPEAIPRKLQVLIQDTELPAFEGREEFKTITGATVTSVVGDLEELRVQIQFSPAKKYLVQRVTVENLTLDMRWSADARPGSPAVIEGIVARENDRLRLIYNDTTYGVVSLMGYGVAVLDLNAIESNDEPDKPSGYVEMRELVRLTSGKLYEQCGTLPEVAIPNLEFTPDAAVRTVPGSSDIQVFALDPNRGVLDLLVKPPVTEAQAQLAPDRMVCNEYQERMSGTGLVFRTLKNPSSTPPVEPFYDHPRLAKLRELFTAQTGHAPFGRFNAAAPYVWTLEAKDNHTVTPSTGPGVPSLGQRGSFAGERTQREYVLIPGNEYGLLVVEIGGTPPAAIHPGAPPLTSAHLVDVIWIPHGAYAARTIPRTKLATVTDGEGHVLLVDLTRIDERWNAEGAIADDELFPTVRSILETNVLTPDPRIVWRSAEPLASGTLAPVVDPETGFVFAGKLLDKTTNAVAAIDPRIQIKADLGAAGGLSEIGGIVPLGIAPPPSIQLNGSNASLGAFRFEVTLPGALNESIPSGQFQLDVDSERVFGAKTAETTIGWPRAHAKLTMQRTVPGSMTKLRFQRGFNKWISPWVVAIADPRASEKYKWPTDYNPADAGCFSCSRPAHLKGNEDIAEIYTNGRLLRVHPNVDFSGSPYDYLAEGDRLTARFSTVMADSVRAPEVLVAAQSPAVAGGMLQDTTFLHSGEIETSGVDLVAEGRADWDVVFDRTYRSRSIGGSPVGMGWDTSMFRRLRALPNGDVEYRDGAGEIWRYKSDGSGGYAAPKGLFLALSRNDRGWLLIDQQGRQTGFDNMGRLVFDADEFATNPYAVDEGNVVRYLYGADGLLQTILDPVGRQSKLTYVNDFLRAVEDSRGRIVTYEQDNYGRLLKVKLPPVENTDEVDPAIAYGVQPFAGTYNELLEIAPNIHSVSDLKGVQRVGFTYGTGADRDKVTRQDWATSEFATFAYSPNAATVHDALKQERRYMLTASAANYDGDRTHVRKLEEMGVETSTQAFGALPITATAGAPNREPQTRTFDFTHHEQGMVATATLAGIRTTTNTWKTLAGVPGFVLQSTSTTPASGASHPGGTRASTFAYAGKAFINAVEITDTIATKRVNVPVVHGKTTTATAFNDDITEELKVDSYGRLASMKSAGGTEPGGGSLSTPAYRDDGPLHARGKIGGMNRAGIVTTIKYPTPTTIETSELERNVTTTTQLDTWLRPKKVVTNGPQLQLDNEVAYDANGRVRTSKRQLGPDLVTQTFAYDALGRVKSSKSDRVAVGEDPNTVSETTVDYDLPARTIRRTLPGGAVITELLDGLGRVKTRTTTTGDEDLVEEYAYDLAGNLVYAGDNHVASAHAYDVHGRAIATLHPDRTKTQTTYDPMGNPTLVEERDAGGSLISKTEPSFSQAGRLQSIQTNVDEAQTRQSTLRWDGAGRTTFTGTGDRFSRSKFTDAGRLLTATTPFTTFTAVDHESTLVKSGLIQEKGSATSVSTSQQYDTLANVTQEAVGPLAWRRTFDQDGNLTSNVQPQRPDTAKFEYQHDSRGNVTSERKAGTEFKYGYDAIGASTAFDDPVDPPTFTVSDRIGRPRERTYPDGTTERFEYDGPRLSQMKDRQGRVFNYDYEPGKGQLIAIRNTTELIEQFEYDAAGRVTKQRTRDAELRFEQFDFEGRPRRTVQTRYANHSGFGARTVLDEYAQEHQWNVHGERKSWTMPAAPAGAPIPPNWTARVDQSFDQEGNVASIERILAGATEITPLMTADYRNAGRPTLRTITTPASASIAREYGYDDATGLLNDLTVRTSGIVVAGSRVEHESLQVTKATLHGVSNESRTNEYSYDLRGRLLTSSIARAEGAAASTEHLDDADFRHQLERPGVIGSLPSLSFEREVGHKIVQMTRGTEAPRSFGYAGGAERVSDGRFTYEFDARGRLIKATELILPSAPSSLSLRRIHYDYSATGRVVGRRAEYARLASASTPPLETDWKLEDRPEILDADALPAETTFVWDVISDQLVAIYSANGTLLRQIIHGGNGYDDPIEVAAYDATIGVGRLYPIFDEAAAGTLQAIVNEDGEVVSRTVAEGAYGEDEFGLAGAAVDRIAITATKTSGGALESVDVTIRATEVLDAATVATGARLAVVDPETGAVVRSATTTPSLIDNETATLRWTLTATEWNTLVAGTSGSLSIAVTSTLRAAAWSAENGILPATGAPLRSSPDLPVEFREPLSSLTPWIASLPAGTQTINLFAAPALSTLASSEPPKASRVIVAAGFQALPFFEPATGLILARARWYDPSTGTFLTPDPMGYTDSSNLYAGFAGDPVNNRDPLGNCVNPFKAECRADMARAIRIADTYALELNDAAINTAVEFNVGVLEGIVNFATAGQYNSVKQGIQQGKIRVPGSLKEANQVAQNINDAQAHGIGQFVTFGTLDRSMEHLESGGSAWTQPLVAVDERIGYSKMDSGMEKMLAGDVWTGATEFSEGFSKLTSTAAGLLGFSQAVAPNSILSRNVGAALDDAGVTTPSTRWTRGQSIVRKTQAGNSPAWGTVRSRYWKNQGVTRAPTRVNDVTGEIESMELNHRFIPQRWKWVPDSIRNAPWNLERVWPAEHAAVDWYRWQTLDPRLKATVPQPSKPWF